MLTIILVLIRWNIEFTELGKQIKKNSMKSFHSYV